MEINREKIDPDLIISDFWNKYEKNDDLERYKMVKKLKIFNSYIINKEIFREGFYSVLQSYFDDLIGSIRLKSFEELLSNKKVIYINPIKKLNLNRLDYYKVLRKKPFVYEVWLVDNDQKIGDLGGEDWEDNSNVSIPGIPNSKKCKGLTKVKIYLNKPLKVKENNE